MSKKNKEKVAVAEEAPQAPNATQKNEKNELPEPSPLELLQDEMEKEKDRYLRLFAEFENYKRRTGKERLELFKTASQDVMVSLLPILDDFERALKEIEKSEEDTLFKGVELIHQKLKETLRQKGLEVVVTQAGDDFDSELHEAVTQIPAPSDDLKGKIVDVLEKGYQLGEKIIRYPKVVTGQ
ncbi:MAG TPA: nucleotide exchange factor GrpE [Flavobacteriaceae bacterium]|nr:nucleotide exchange factor GrpE [Flavobacteriaceae bacterium]MCB9213663.1 nucleotide exchange factor GrpE [Alteromonas sp.]HPF12164.1 nucleotide exchange factor GrpE [Flavobacteriaceae bacterium]HQU22297.1 nucleotide exchange factor GrpE [Flavobacteriaceae bacterium]HQU65993.1 nucleotide exchange factor GrpE [Flavobacteriaceae bacterium]